MHERICDGRARHKSWCDATRDESGRLYARRCYSKDTDITSGKEEEREDKEDEDEDDDTVAVINHKDSMCILVEKYQAGRRRRAGKCEDQAADRSAKDECNKSLTLDIIDQQELPESAVPREEPSVKHACRAHCENCGTALADVECNRGPGHVPPEIEYELLKVAPLSELASSRRCSMRAPCRRAF